MEWFTIKRNLYQYGQFKVEFIYILWTVILQAFLAAHKMTVKLTPTDSLRTPSNKIVFSHEGIQLIFLIRRTICILRYSHLTHGPKQVFKSPSMYNGILKLYFIVKSAEHLKGIESLTCFRGPQKMFIQLLWSTTSKRLRTLK